MLFPLSFQGMKRLKSANCCPVLIPPSTSPVFGQWRIYIISMGSMVIGSNMLQSHLLSTTTMKRLLLGICWITKDLPITAHTATNKDLRKEVGEGWREGLELDWHGYDVNFHLCQRIYVMSVHIISWQKGDRLKRHYWMHVKRMTSFAVSCQ